MTEQAPDRKILLGKSIDEPALREKLTLPRTKRRETIEKFRQELGEQKEGLAGLQEKMLVIVRQNPNASPSELEAKMEAINQTFNITAEQKDLARATLEAYLERHQVVEEAIKKYPDPPDLYNALFRRKPKGKIEVIAEPATLYIRVHDLEDYAWISSHRHLMGGELTPVDIRNAQEKGGITPGVVFVPGLEGAITVENARGREFGEDSRKTKKHEEQHAFENLFRRVVNFQRVLEEMPKFAAKIKAEQNPERKKILLRRYFREFRDNIMEERTKGEILAFLKTARVSAEKLYQLLTAPGEKGGDYDFFRYDSQRLVDELMYKLGDSDYILLNDVADSVLQTEYRALIRKAVEAFTLLRERGYTEEGAAAFLMHEPIWNWQKAVKRQLASKRPGLAK